MPSKRTEGKAPSHDVEFIANRKPNWKNDLKFGHQRRRIISRFFRIA
jgi:hypothetical protein